MEINVTSQNAHAKDCIAKFFDAVADVGDSATENISYFWGSSEHFPGCFLHFLAHFGNLKK